MTWFDALILGIIQGLTEFLPVSSSGHLELSKSILGDNSVPSESLLFTVMVHAATALSTLVVFRKDVFKILKGLFAFKRNEEFLFSLKIILSMIPAAVIGLLFNDEIEMLFGGQSLLVGSMLIITGLLLFLADKAKNTNRSVSFPNALIIGIAQAVAILPGISRSGATIATSVLLGVDREKAARFSFLMVVPLILGKMAKDLMDGNIAAQGDKMLVLFVAFLSAFLTGLIACRWMIKLVRKSQLRYFAYYCFAVGALAVFMSLYV
jgi:undecaprenyl-diphosphatase